MRTWTLLCLGYYPWDLPGILGLLRLDHGVCHGSNKRAGALFDDPDTLKPMLSDEWILSEVIRGC